jgi:hypothetical protein
MEDKSYVVRETKAPGKSGAFVLEDDYVLNFFS